MARFIYLLCNQNNNYWQGLFQDFVQEEGEGGKCIAESFKRRQIQIQGGGEPHIKYTESQLLGGGVGVGALNLWWKSAYSRKFLRGPISQFSQLIGCLQISMFMQHVHAHTDMIAWVQPALNVEECLSCICKNWAPQKFPANNHACAEGWLLIHARYIYLYKLYNTMYSICDGEFKPV